MRLVPTVNRLVRAGLVVAIVHAIPAGVEAQGVHSMRRLGGPTRVTAPVRTVEELQKTFASASLQTDVGTVLNERGLGSLQAELLRNITEGTVQETSVQPGTTLEWTTLRLGGAL